MLTFAANAAVIIWVTLLISAPSLVFALHRPASPAVIAGGGALTLVAVCLVTYVVCDFGYGDVLPLRGCTAVLTVILAWAVVKGVLLVKARRPLRLDRGWLAVPLGAALGFWVLVPPLIAIKNVGLTFGMATLGNNDIANYALVADNTAMAGFRDAHHVANADVGSIARNTYLGATALINFVSGATGLSAVRATLVTMGVAVSLLTIALWALGTAIWPSSRRAVTTAVVVAVLAALNSYTYAEFFLGAVLGLAGIATALAGATLLARRRGIAPLAMASAGGALTVYAYGHLGLPLLVALPFWAVIVSRLEVRTLRQRTIIVASRAVVAVAVALVLASPVLKVALALVRQQSDVTAGWSLPPLTSVATVVFPDGIGHRFSAKVVVISWLAAAALVVIALVAAHRGAYRASARISAVFFLCTTLIMGGAVVIYGADRYQTWKMLSYLLPIAAAAVLPALGIVGRVISDRVPTLRVVLAGLAAMVLLSPLLVWSAVLRKETALNITSPTLMNLNATPALAGVTRLNVWMPSYFEAMVAGAALTKPVIVFSSPTYYSQEVSLSTCTLTRRDMLGPGETHFTDLGNGYVLLDRPGSCH